MKMWASHSDCHSIIAYVWKMNFTSCPMSILFNNKKLLAQVKEMEQTSLRGCAL